AVCRQRSLAHDPVPTFGCSWISPDRLASAGTGLLEEPEALGVGDARDEQRERRLPIGERLHRRANAEALLGVADADTSLPVQGPMSSLRSGVVGSVGGWGVRTVGGVGVVRAGAQSYFGPRPSGCLRGRRHDV